MDHNSEQFTFSMPRYIENHDMSRCNKVRIHYTNYGDKGEKFGIYEVDDFAVSEDGETMSFTWLLSQNATTIVGRISLVVRFFCINDAGEVLYSWGTITSSPITVSESVYNLEDIPEQNPDIWIEPEKAAKPVIIPIELALNGTFTIAGYTVAQIREMAKLGSVRLRGIYMNHDDEITRIFDAEITAEPIEILYIGTVIGEDGYGRVTFDNCLLILEDTDSGVLGTYVKSSDLNNANGIAKSLI